MIGPVDTLGRGHRVPCCLSRNFEDSEDLRRNCTSGITPFTEAWSSASDFSLVACHIPGSAISRFAALRRWERERDSWGCRMVFNHALWHRTRSKLMSSGGAARAARQGCNCGAERRTGIGMDVPMFSISKYSFCCKSWLATKRHLRKRYD